MTSSIFNLFPVLTVLSATVIFRLISRTVHYNSFAKLSFRSGLAYLIAYLIVNLNQDLEPAIELIATPFLVICSGSTFIWSILKTHL